MSLNAAMNAMSTINRVGLESGCPLSPLAGGRSAGAALASAVWAAQALACASVAPAEASRNDWLEEEPERWDGLS